MSFPDPIPHFKPGDRVRTKRGGLAGTIQPETRRVVTDTRRHQAHFGVNVAWDEDSLDKANERRLVPLNPTARVHPGELERLEES
jgi:hypothetical protein